MHRESHGAKVRVQIDSEEEAVEEGGDRGRSKRDSDAAASLGAAEHSGIQRGL